MAKIKHTKNELKAQRDALKRYQRYLPTLMLKKQQLQMEVRGVEAKLEEYHRREAALDARLAGWVRLFSEPYDVGALVRLRRVRTGVGNIAGVTIPILEAVEFDRTMPDLFNTPPWVDDGRAALEEMIRLRVEREVLEAQLRALRDELRTTTQRVNLFEKVKIPETRENIRVIRIFLGDQMTAAVSRAKIAKGKSSEKATAAG
ncbi:MAG: V-type ATP synthase subunit D [Kiritimatiellae bacterium]|nr:V-type ATP synthase subunit D [Kiritimatiellia bacterium]